MSLSPLRKTLASPLSAEATFDAFCDVAAWWPLGAHAVSALSLGRPAQMAEFRPEAGFEIYEIDAEGARHPWGEVLSATPGAALAYTWRPSAAPEEATKINVAFETAAEGSTVILVHDGWAVRGDDAAKLRAGYDTGWDHVLGDCFGGRLAALSEAAAG